MGNSFKLSNLMEKIAFELYNISWALAIPALRLNSRLKEGFSQRKLQFKLPRADIWIQAASVGESYLARELIKNLNPKQPVRIFATSNTSQGIEILKRSTEDVSINNKNISAQISFFPFDKPALMEKAANNIRPKVMVLLEAEIWPGLLSALKKSGCKILIVNGRITPKSLNRYLVWPSIWRRLNPDKILAVSKNDARRFSALFGSSVVEEMPNMKFDRVNPAGAGTKNPIADILQPGTKLLVLGSVRSEEEDVVTKIILHIRSRLPDTVIGLFPRHMHRIKHWEKILNNLKIKSILRSKIKSRVLSGTLIIWDTFGELPFAYELANAAFVGGSLAPLGGQNFLEALISGIKPVIGPSWENFAWVGSEIIEKKLVQPATCWEEVAEILIKNMQAPVFHKAVQKEALEYIQDHRGGTNRACRYILKFLNDI